MTADWAGKHWVTWARACGAMPPTRRESAIGGARHESLYRRRIVMAPSVTCAVMRWTRHRGICQTDIAAGSKARLGIDRRREAGGINQASSGSELSA